MRETMTLMTLWCCTPCFFGPLVGLGGGVRFVVATCLGWVAGLVFFWSDGQAGGRGGRSGGSSERVGGGRVAKRTMLKLHLCSLVSMKPRGAKRGADGMRLSALSPSLSVSVSFRWKDGTESARALIARIPAGTLSGCGPATGGRTRSLPETLAEEDFRRLLQSKFACTTRKRRRSLPEVQRPQDEPEQTRPQGETKGSRRKVATKVQRPHGEAESAHPQGETKGSRQKVATKAPCPDG